MKKQQKAFIYTFICVLLWALIPVVSKTGQRTLDNHQFLFWSSLVSFLSLFLLLAFTKKIKILFTFSLRDIFYSSTLGFLGTYLYYMLLYFGYKNSNGMTVLVIQYSWPVFIIIIAAIILKEQITIKKAIGALLGFGGVFLVITRGQISTISFSDSYSLLLILCGSFSFALFSVLSKKIELEPYSLNTVYFLTATVFSFFSMLIFSDFKFPDKNSLLPIIINGMFVNGYSYVLWILALKEAKASFAATVVFLTPVVAAMYLVVFFGEPLIAVYIAGLLAVISAGILGSNS